MTTSNELRAIYAALIESMPESGLREAWQVLADLNSRHLALPLDPSEEVYACGCRGTRGWRCGVHSDP